MSKPFFKPMSRDAFVAKSISCLTKLPVTEVDNNQVQFFREIYNNFAELGGVIGDINVYELIYGNGIPHASRYGGTENAFGLGLGQIKKSNFPYMDYFYYRAGTAEYFMIYENKVLQLTVSFSDMYKKD